MDSVTPTATKTREGVSPAMFRAAIYLVAFITGAIVMSFEMLGSRYLNPYFGSSIYTWAALISTVLAALTAGYFLGGFLADRTASATVLGAIIALASVYLLLLPGFADTILRLVSESIDDVRLGSLDAALAIMFLPVMLLGVYSPFAVRLVLHATQRSGTVSGAVYGVSTFGSIAGTLGTTFFLIPAIGSRAITLWLGAIGFACGLSLIALDRMRLRSLRSAAGLVLFAVAVLVVDRAGAGELIDENQRAQMLKHGDGRVAHLETEYNDLFIDKHGSELGLSSRYKGRPDYVESMVDLRDPDVMPVEYNRIVPAVLAYPDDIRRILMIGLGAGSISTYLGRAMPDVKIDVIELDPGVIVAGKDYFGLRETDQVKFIESDGRVWLNRHKETYDLILLDAFRELGVPFHMLTREFYALVRDHLAPGGAVASNVVANTKLYASTLVTLQAVFPIVDIYPAWAGPSDAQAIAVAVPGPRPTTESLMQRALALQARYRFRYPVTNLVGKRVTKLYAKDADVLTDDFAPADLYRVTPIKTLKGQ
jgi:spermidine synthase